MALKFSKEEHMNITDYLNNLGVRKKDALF